MASFSKFQRPVGALALATTMAFGLVACDTATDSPEALYVAFEKAMACDVGPVSEVVELFMPQTAASGRYVEALRQNWYRQDDLVKVTECHNWDDARRITETRAVEVSPGKWRIEGATSRPGYFQPIMGVHVARMDNGDLKIVAGNP